MDIKNAVIGGLVGLAALFGGLFLLTPEPPTPAPPQLGALSSPDIASPYLSFGGVREWAYTTSMTNASTTCAIQSPAATSTLVAATFYVTVAPTTTPQFEIGNATTAFATTTSLAKHHFSANTFRSVIATTSVTALTDGIVPPSTYVNVKQGGGGGSFVPTGVCKAVFREV